MKRGDRILVAIELGFAAPLTLTYLVLRSEQFPPAVWFGLADRANRVVGLAFGLSAHAARWRPEGYWFQDVLLTVAAAAVIYPLIGRKSTRILGAAGLAMPLSASAVMAGVHASSRTWHFIVLACIAGAWGFGVLSAWGLPRERDLVDRRVLVGGMGVVLLAAAGLLMEAGTLYFGVSAWGATLLGALAWGRWVKLTGCVKSGACGGAQQGHEADEA